MTDSGPAVRVAGPPPLHPYALSGLTMAMLGGLVAVLIAGFLVLVLTGNETTTYTLFVAGPLVTTIVGALIGQRVKVVEDVARAVETQTNGALSANLAHIHEHLDQQTAELLESPGADSPSGAADPRPGLLPAQQQPSASEARR